MSKPVTLDIQQIQKMIPHRFPMLLVDRVENLVLGESCTGVKCVTINEPFFQGHFPHLSVMPGVLIVEAMAQAAGTLVIHTLGLKGEVRPVYFMSIEQARFRKPVVPGDVLYLQVQRIQNRRNVWKFKGEAKVNNTLHAEAIFTAMFMEGE